MPDLAVRVDRDELALVLRARAIPHRWHGLDLEIPAQHRAEVVGVVDELSSEKSEVSKRASHRASQVNRQVRRNSIRLRVGPMWLLLAGATWFSFWAMIIKRTPQ